MEVDVADLLLTFLLLVFSWAGSKQSADAAAGDSSALPSIPGRLPGSTAASRKGKKKKGAGPIGRHAADVAWRLEEQGGGDATGGRGDGGSPPCPSAVTEPEAAGTPSADSLPAHEPGGGNRKQRKKRGAAENDGQDQGGLPAGGARKEMLPRRLSATADVVTAAGGIRRKREEGPLPADLPALAAVPAGSRVRPNEAMWSTRSGDDGEKSVDHERSNPAADVRGSRRPDEDRELDGESGAAPAGGAELPDDWDAGDDEKDNDTEEWQREEVEGWVTVPKGAPA